MACPMPTYCEPCPGNTNASFIDLPAQERAAPGHASADGHHQDQVAILQLARAVRLIERERDRCRRGVAYLVDVDLALLQRDLQPLHHRVEDPEIGLVRDHVVHVLGSVTVALQRLAGSRLQHPYRRLVDLAAVHLDELLTLLPHLRTERP